MDIHIDEPEMTTDLPDFLDGPYPNMDGEGRIICGDMWRFGDEKVSIFNIPDNLYAIDVRKLRSNEEFLSDEKAGKALEMLDSVSVIMARKLIGMAAREIVLEFAKKRGMNAASLEKRVAGKFI